MDQFLQMMAEPYTYTKVYANSWWFLLDIVFRIVPALYVIVHVGGKWLKGIAR